MQSNAIINLNTEAHLEAAIDLCNPARQMLCLNVLQRSCEGGGLVNQFENFTTVRISQKDTIPRIIENLILLKNLPFFII